MPGSEIDPNVDAANIVAFGFNMTLRELQSFAQFPTEVETDKVQNFFTDIGKTNVSIRFDNTQFP